MGLAVGAHLSRDAKFAKSVLKCKGDGIVSYLSTLPSKRSNRQRPRPLLFQSTQHSQEHLGPDHPETPCRG